MIGGVGGVGATPGILGAGDSGGAGGAGAGTRGLSGEANKDSHVIVVSRWIIRSEKERVSEEGNFSSEYPLS